MLEPVRTKSVKVMVRMRPGSGGPAAEHLWAEPLDAGDAGGTYRLLNNGFYCPFLLDDVVRAELNADELLQVTEFVRSGGRDCVGVGVEPEKATLVARIADAWRQTGTYSEGVHGCAFVVSRPPSPAARPDDAELDRMQRDGLILRWESWRPYDFGPHDALPDIDLRLCTEPDPARHPQHTTTYWAGDDPYWREQGIDDPDFLAYVQGLAEEDVQVARALERGKHDQVIRFINLRAMDPHDWPKDEQIFDPEDTEGELD